MNLNSFSHTAHFLNEFERYHPGSSFLHTFVLVSHLSSRDFCLCVHVCMSVCPSTSSSCAYCTKMNLNNFSQIQLHILLQCLKLTSHPKIIEHTHTNTQTVHNRLEEGVDRYYILFHIIATIHISVVAADPTK